MFHFLFYLAIFISNVFQLSPNVTAKCWIQLFVVRGFSLWVVGFLIFLWIDFERPFFNFKFANSLVLETSSVMRKLSDTSMVYRTYCFASKLSFLSSLNWMLIISISFLHAHLCICFQGFIHQILVLFSLDSTELVNFGYFMLLSNVGFACLVFILSLFKISAYLPLVPWRGWWALFLVSQTFCSGMYFLFVSKSHKRRSMRAFLLPINIASSFVYHILMEILVSLLEKLILSFHVTSLMRYHNSVWT